MSLYFNTYIKLVEKDYSLVAKKYKMINSRHEAANTQSDPEKETIYVVSAATPPTVLSI